MFTKSIILVAAAATSALAQGAAYAQCGGIGFKGPTTCVSGYHCQYNSPYYSQCIPGTGSGSSPTTLKTSTTSAASAAPTSPASGNGGVLKASFTEYGAGDSFGSPNCNTDTAACGFYTSPGYSAAISQNVFGVGPGAGAGPACNTCYRLTIETDSSGNRVSNAGNSIVVKINNLCPANGNPLCAQNGLSGTNQYGANVNFDTCKDSGASAALFGNSGVGLGIGTAVQVDCNSQYTGTTIH
ncbi:hypothetical protein LTR62_003698 [Meristemomyces frigidus]|uniref:CBM1 domain-containing protein n=1 Tax=Meristemomyces frigidus TaxID=1508187 RepID=A0AAN7YPK5_9PEZI|nr:hypothetical protein LTR62_003698 [Meristemomyces frigidus]